MESLPSDLLSTSLIASHLVSGTHKGRRPRAPRLCPGESAPLRSSCAAARSPQPGGALGDRRRPQRPPAPRRPTRSREWGRETKAVRGGGPGSLAASGRAPRTDRWRRTGSAPERAPARAPGPHAALGTRSARRALLTQQFPARGARAGLRFRRPAAELPGAPSTSFLPKGKTVETTLAMKNWLDYLNYEIIYTIWFHFAIKCICKFTYTGMYVCM